jgi:two-component SAPR family response regulator
VSNTTRLSIVLNNMGVLNHLNGDYIHAVDLFEEALAHARRNHLPRSEAYLLCGIGDLYMDLEAVENAQDAYQRSRDIAEQIDDRFLLLYLSVVDASLARHKGDLILARALLQPAKDLAQKSSSNYETALWRMEAGQIDLAGKIAKISIDHLSEAVRLFTEGGQKIEAARANMALAHAYYSLNDKFTALDSLEHAFTLVSDLESQHALVVAGRDTQIFLREACHDPQIGPSAASLLNHIHQFEKQLPALRRRLRPKTSTVLFAPPKISIFVLGRTRVELDGKPVNAVEWVNQKRTRELFFFLLSHPEGKTREEIGDILWSESSPSQLKLQFKNAIYRLRYALGQDIVLFDGIRYSFNHDLDFEYDAHIFEEKVKQAKAASSSEDKISCYQEVIELYRGHYLPDGDGTWVLTERERLWQMQVNAILALVRLYLEAGDYTAALELIHKVLKEDHCLEEAHCLAMRAYAAQGNRAAVKRQYDDCRNALQLEIDSEPSKQTQLLYKTLIG